MKARVGQIRRFISEALSNTARERVSPSEVLATWEDLYVNSTKNRRKGDIEGLVPGHVSLEELASWLGVGEDVVKRFLHGAGLIVDKHGNVVERGITVPPPS